MEIVFNEMGIEWSSSAQIAATSAAERVKISLGKQGEDASFRFALHERGPRHVLSTITLSFGDERFVWSGEGKNPRRACKPALRLMEEEMQAWAAETAGEDALEHLLEALARQLPSFVRDASLESGVALDFVEAEEVFADVIAEYAAILGTVVDFEQLRFGLEHHLRAALRRRARELARARWRLQSSASFQFAA